MKNVNPLRNDNSIENLYAYLGTKNEKYVILQKIGLKTGLRVTDILNLKAKQIVQNMTVYERKTGKQKTCPLGKELYSEIQDYIKRKKFAPNEYIIPSTNYRRNKPLSRVQAYKVIKAAADAAGLKNIGTHSMRKTYAYNLFKETGSLYEVQNALNHKYPDTTLRYLLGDDMAVELRPKE